MMYEILKVNEKEYKLRLGVKETIELEKKLGCNPLVKLMEMGENNLPETEFILDVLHASLQKFNKGMTMNKVYDLYDELVDEGCTLEEFLQLIIKIFTVSGFLKQDALEKAVTEIEAK